MNYLVQDQFYHLRVAKNVIIKVFGWMMFNAVELKVNYLIALMQHLGLMIAMLITNACKLSVERVEDINPLNIIMINKQEQYLSVLVLSQNRFVRMDLMKQQQESFACQFIKTRVLDLMKLVKVAKIQIFGLIISDVKEVKNNLTNVATLI